MAVLGQTALPAARLERAPELRAIVNVEGNFLPNVDYEAALDRGIHVLNASPAFALPVAEMALGMAIDLARGISGADRAMRAGRERYGLESNADAFLLAGSAVGIIGFGGPGPGAAPATGAVRVPGQGLRPVAAGAGRAPRGRRAGGARGGPLDLARDLRLRVGDERERGPPRPVSYTHLTLPTTPYV